MQRLIQIIEEFECLETLKLNLNNSSSAITWLNNLYGALINLKNISTLFFNPFPTLE